MKNQDKWDKVTLLKYKGAQFGKENASGHGVPKKNSNVEKHGLFRKYFLEEIFSILGGFK